MKKHILTVAAAALLSIPTYTIAQDKPAGDKPAGDKPAGERPERGGRGGGARFSPEERLKRMTEALGLTDEQQTKYKEMIAKNAEEMKALREKSQNGTDEEKKAAREKFMEISKKQQDDFAAILTPEQKEKMKTLRGPGGEGRRPGGPGGAPGGAPGGGEKKPEEKK